MSEKGFMVIADITGYTRFLSGTELEHAQESLKSLLELLVEETKEPLQISRLEGDAVISFALKSSFVQGQTLLENLENTYVAFRQAQQWMRLNTSCTCRACKNIPNLDLKFLVHFGEFMIQDLGPFRELVGAEVNLIHRLLKNQITDTTGIRAYAAFTEAAKESLQLPDQDLHLEVHEEPDDYLEQVRLYVRDMKSVWDHERDRRQIRVDLEEALVVTEDDFPIGPALLWDYLTAPDFRAVLLDADSVEVEERQGGRINPGSVYVCAHGDMRIRQAIVDWRPFKYFSYEMAGMVPDTSNLTTVYLQPLAEGTRVVVAISYSSGPDAVRDQNDRIVAEQAPEFIKAGCQRLLERVEADLELGIIVQPQVLPLASNQIEAAVDQALTQPTV